VLPSAPRRQRLDALVVHAGNVVQSVAFRYWTLQ
jgi:hypothetical protein